MDVVRLFRTAGDGDDGDTVSHLEHALQCAALARRDRADDEVVVAPLLHDVGHLALPAADDERRHHGHHGAARLSAASARSLSRQGATLDAHERLSLELQPWFADAVRIRRWDDEAKVPNAVCPPLTDYRSLLERWLGPQSWSMTGAL